MAEERSHKIAANRIATRHGVECNNGPGADVKAARATIEVETLHTVADAPSQLRGYRGPVYIAGANQDTVQKALEITKGTTIGVMNGYGDIIKSSTRKR